MTLHLSDTPAPITLDKTQAVSFLVEQAEDRAQFIADPANPWAKKSAAVTILLEAAARMSGDKNLKAFVEARALIERTDPFDYAGMSEAHYALREAAAEIHEEADVAGFDASERAGEA